MITNHIYIYIYQPYLKLNNLQELIYYYIQTTIFHCLPLYFSPVVSSLSLPSLFLLHPLHFFSIFCFSLFPLPFSLPCLYLFLLDFSLYSFCMNPLIPTAIGLIFHETKKPTNQTSLSLSLSISISFVSLFFFLSCLVSWGCRIHWKHLYRGIKDHLLAIGGNS